MIKTKRLFLLLSATVLCASAQGQDLGAAALDQAWRDLSTDLRLMCVAAHPDDEDGATLARYRKFFGLKTFAVIATRGEGGQNEIGPELYDELGVIRTREMQAAAQVTGAGLYFLDLPEFGFSKTLEETQRIWGKEETLRRVVRVIRKLRPDVIITHHGHSNDHGHHQAIGAAVIEAFDAAADPTQFPEQLAEGLKPCQPARLYIRTWEQTPESITVEINEMHPILGETSAQIAARALDQHRSQGMEFFKRRYLSGETQVFYELVKEAPEARAFHGVIEAPAGELLRGLKDRVTPETRAMSVQGLAGAAAREVALDALAEARAQRDNGADAWARWERLNALAIQLCALRASAHVEHADGGEYETIVTRNQRIALHARLLDYGAQDVAGAAYSIPPNPWTGAVIDTISTQEFSAMIKLTTREDSPFTLPAPHHYREDLFLNPRLECVIEARLADNRAVIELRAPVHFDTAPSILVQPLRPYYFAQANTEQPASVEFVLTNHEPGPNEGTLVYTASSRLTFEAQRIPVAFTAEDEQRVVRVQATFHTPPAPGDYHVTAMMAEGGPACDAVIRVSEVAVPENIRVGLIESYDTTLAQTLEFLGVPYDSLTLEDFIPERLDKFTSVLVDMRAYFTRPDLAANNRALLEYAGRGGSVIVMYQKTFEWNEAYAPYPLTLSRNRVADEHAPVTVLAPEHPVFNTPNRIEPRDWDDWVQERGLYFAETWDPRYTPLIACADPGEDIPPGSWLVVNHGEGTYMYTALVWYRQLRELHPGALRLFANMLAL